MSRKQFRSATCLCALVWGLIPGVPAQGQAVVGGVMIDADGVLSNRLVRADSNQLQMRRNLARNPILPADLAAPSTLRHVSLAALEKAVLAAADSGQPLPEHVRYLAGLQKVRYLFVYPESGDIVLAGPAEGWTTNAVGRVIGWKSGRPVLLLDDLIAVLRAARATGGRVKIGCRIEPTQQGLARLQEYLRRVRHVRDFSRVPEILAGMQAALGRHTVSVFGVPAGSHAGLVMVEADYRMKLIGIDLAPRPFPGFRTFLDFAARPGAGSRKSLMRWWLMPFYTAIVRSTAGDAFELRGQPVKLAAELEYVQSGGTRRATGRVDRASRLYTTEFTRKYAQVAGASPVFAELENLTDLAMVAAIIFREGLLAKTGWSPDALCDAPLDQPQPEFAPKQVNSVVNYRFVGRRVLTPVGGGVIIDTASILDALPIEADQEDVLARHRLQAQHAATTAHRFWWDEPAGDESTKSESR